MIYYLHGKPPDQYQVLIGSLHLSRTILPPHGPRPTVILTQYGTGNDALQLWASMGESLDQSSNLFTLQSQTVGFLPYSSLDRFLKFGYRIVKRKETRHPLT